MSDAVAAETLARYTRRIESATQRRETRVAALGAERAEVLERDRLAIALVSLASHERRLVLYHHAHGTASRRVVETLLRGSDTMVDAARTDGRSGYIKAVKRVGRYTIGFSLRPFPAPPGPDRDAPRPPPGRAAGTIARHLHAARRAGRFDHAEADALPRRAIAPDHPGHRRDPARPDPPHAGRAPGAISRIFGGAERCIWSRRPCARSSRPIAASMTKG